MKALTSSLTPITTTSTNSLKLSAEVHGLGPTFRLVLELCSTETSTNLFLAFACNGNIYWIERNYIQVSHLAPGLTYSYSTRVQCVSEFNVSDQIKVSVCGSFLSLLQFQSLVVFSGCWFIDEDFLSRILFPSARLFPRFLKQGFSLLFQFILIAFQKPIHSHCSCINQFIHFLTFFVAHRYMSWKRVK